MDTKQMHTTHEATWLSKFNSRRFSFALGLSCLGLALLAVPKGRAADGDSTVQEPSNPKAAAEKDDQVKLAPEAMKHYGISVGIAKKRRLTSHLIVPARVSFNTTAMAVVGCPLQGRITELKVAVGDSVKRGDELLVVESVELGEAQSDDLQKRTGVVAAQAAVDPAKGAFERAKSLYDSSQGVTLTELQKREVDYKTAQNTLLIAKAAANAAESKLRLFGMSRESIDQLTQSGEVNPLYTARSPISGTVTERLVTLGELVKPDREKLMVVADMSTLWVLADVPESRFAEVKPGAKATVSVGDQSITATVSRIGLSVDSSTRCIPVRIDVKADPILRPGMFAQVDITSRLGGEGKESTVLAIPSSAVQTVEGGSTAVFIPVKGQPNTFTRRLVSLGDSAGGMVEIVSGLDEGEQIVTAGTFILKAELSKASAKDED
jgi:cobalt-zinc-cadmium efflux system membrane fusion protein